jgi:hypothetical protein
MSYFASLESNLLHDETLIGNRVEILERIKSIRNDNGQFFNVIKDVFTLKNKLASDFLDKTIIDVLCSQKPELRDKLETDEGFFNSDDFIDLFSTGLLKKGRVGINIDTVSKTHLIDPLNAVIHEYESQYLSDKFDSNLLYYRLGKIASSFNCYKGKNNILTIQNYIVILTCICAFNKYKLIMIEYKKLIEEVIVKVYRCFGYKKGIAEAARAMIKSKSSNTKGEKTKLAGVIIAHKEMNTSYICSTKELFLIKKNTYYFESIHGKLQALIAPTVVAIIAIGITLIFSAVSDFPGAGVLSKFPLYVNPIFSVFGALTGTHINQSYGTFVKSSLKSIEEKSVTKEFIKEYVMLNDKGDLKARIDRELESDSRTPCKEHYPNIIIEYKKYIEKANQNFDIYNFRKTIYIDLFDLLCKTKVAKQIKEDYSDILDIENATDIANGNKEIEEVQLPVMPTQLTSGIKSKLRLRITEIKSKGGNKTKKFRNRNKITK